MYLSGRYDTILGSQDAYDDDENAENITNGNELDMNIERSSDEIHLEIGIHIASTLSNL